MKRVLSIVLVLALSLSVTFLAACGGQEPAGQPPEAPQPADTTETAEDPEPVEERELVTVRIGNAPYPMYQVFNVASYKGIDHYFGINLEIISVTSGIAGAQALYRGDVDIISNCVAEHLPQTMGAPTITNFTPLGFFKGFFFIGHEGDLEPWADLYERMGDQARYYRLEEFRGRSFAIIVPRRPLIVDAINQVGMTDEDVEFLFFADDARAALAFQTGEADFYIGSLPQQVALLRDDAFINVGGDAILGPAGMWFDTMTTTDAFMLEDRETALRTLAVMFASINAFYADPWGYSEIAARLFSDFTNMETPTEEWYEFMTVYDELQTVEMVRDGFFNPDSHLYWRLTVEFYIDLLVAEGDLAPGLCPDEYYGESQRLFFELLERQDLLDMINSFR